VVPRIALDARCLALPQRQHFHAIRRHHHRMLALGGEFPVASALVKLAAAL